MNDVKNTDGNLQIKIKRLSKNIIILYLMFVISCYNRPIEGNNLSSIGFYSAPRELIKKLENNNPGFKEHFLLGVSYNKIGGMKKAIFHFANSCFKYTTDYNLKLYAHPVYKFVDGFHIKSAYYNDAVYEIAELFFKYREYKYVIKFIDLISDAESALYRNAVILKSKAFLELNKYNEAITHLNKLLPQYEDISSKSDIHIRIASVYEKKRTLTEH